MKMFTIKKARKTGAEFSTTNDEYKDDTFKYLYTIKNKSYPYVFAATEPNGDEYVMQFNKYGYSEPLVDSDSVLNLTIKPEIRTVYINVRENTLSSDKPHITAVFSTEDEALRDEARGTGCKFFVVAKPFQYEVK